MGHWRPFSGAQAKQKSEKVFSVFVFSCAIRYAAGWQFRENGKCCLGAAMIFTHGWFSKRILEFEVLSLHASSSVDGFDEAYGWLLKVPSMAGALYQGNRGF